jgi:acetyl-CoA C-acetyltransferase
MKDSDIVIVSAVRTPFGKMGGALKDIDCYHLGALSMRAALERSSISPDLVNEVWWGMGDTSCCKDVYTPIVARQSLLMAGLPCTTPSCTIDKACVSGTSAIIYGMRSIRMEETHVVMAGGATTFSQEPFILRNARFAGNKMGNITIFDPLVELGYKDFNPVAVDAGNRAIINGVSREEQDEWAFRSHQYYGKALADGKIEDELLPINVSGDAEKPQYVSSDEQYRKDISLEKLSKLKPIYGSPTVTAGNAPGLNDGSAAILLTTRGYAKKIDATPLATIISSASIAAEPDRLCEVPAWAILKALANVNLTAADLALLEINEAFAAMPLVSTKILANDDRNAIYKLREKTNVNGGAIAIGHANTATGVRLVMTMAYELKRRGGGLGAVGICGGLAQGDSIVISVDR